MLESCDDDDEWQLVLGLVIDILDASETREESEIEIRWLEGALQLLCRYQACNE